MTRLTDDQFSALRLLAFSAERGFYGPRPGSNGWPLLEAQTRFGSIEGETVDALERLGLLEARPCDTVRALVIEDEGFDIEINHRWFVSQAGRAALKEEEGRTP